MENETNIFNKKKFPLCVILLLVSAFLNFLGSSIIQKYFPNRLPPSDLLFTITPYIAWTQYLTDLANIFSFFLMIYYIIKYAEKNQNFIVLNYAFAYGLRAFLIILTPFGGALGNNMYYGLTNIQQFGAFPSGHTIMVVLTYMLIDNNISPLLKKMALASVVVEVISLIFSRGHYSIDIVGAFLVCYFVVNKMLQIKSKNTLVYVSNN